MHRIREYFRPYQPSIEYLVDTPVQYTEAEPADELRPYVFCYWRLQTTQPLAAPFLYRVVSDGCVDVLVEQSRPADIFVTGFSTQFIEYDLGTTFDYLGIRFLPTGFPALFQESAATFTNEFALLNESLPDQYQLLSGGLCPILSLQASKDYWNAQLLRWLHSLKEPPYVDPRLLEAMHQILESRGGIALSDLEVAVSERQLRRLFEYYFGHSPKTFAKIIRFQNILAAKPSSSSLRQDKIFYDEGYYDQAHFIREFKALYGVTPTRAFGRISP